MGHADIATPRLKKFKVSEESEMDLRIAVREFSGRMTHARYNILDSYCRRNTFRGDRCCHQWDCCGCLISQLLTFTYKRNQVVITLQRSYNY